MKTNKLFTIILLLTMSVVSCSKDDDDQTTTTTTPPPPAENTVCDGHAGNSSYFPLAQGNQWVYKRNYFVSGNLLDSSTVSGTQVYNGKTYMKMRQYQGIGSSTVYNYYRTEANGDVYLWDTNNSVELLLIPANPALNQILGPDPTHFGTTRKVTSLTASLTTSTCSYTNLMVIQNLGSSGSLISTVYYKKGLGTVHDDDFQVIAATIN
jgi:hypothetical protein